MARGKPKREKAAIPASYIRPRELPNGRTSYNVRAYDPATRTCKTLGTFKTKRAAERAFKKGAEALVANARPEPPPDVAPTASAELDDPRPSRASRRSARARPPPRVRPRAPELAFRRGGAHVPQQEAPEDEKREKRNRRGGEDPGRRPRAAQKQARSAVFRTLASAAAAVSPFANLDVQDVQERREPNMNRRASGSPEGASESSRRRRRAHLSTPAATPPPRRRAAAPSSMVSMGGGDVWSRICAFVRGEYPVPVPGLWKTRSEPGVPRDEGVPEDRDARDSPGPAERLAAADPPRGGCGGGGAAAAGSRDAPRALRSRRGA